MSTISVKISFGRSFGVALSAQNAQIVTVDGQIKAFLTPKDMAEALGQSRRRSAGRTTDDPRCRGRQARHRRIAFRRRGAVRARVRAADRASRGARARGDSSRASLPPASPPPAPRTPSAAFLRDDWRVARGIVKRVRGGRSPSRRSAMARSARRSAARASQWEHGSDGIVIEHRAVDTCLRALSLIRSLIPRAAPTAPVALGAAVANDPCVLPSIAAVVLADAGFDVNLGPHHADTRADQRGQALRSRAGVAHGEHRDRHRALRRDLVAVLEKIPPSGSIVLGGRGIPAGIPRRAGRTCTTSARWSRRSGGFARACSRCALPIPLPPAAGWRGAVVSVRLPRESLTLATVAPCETRSATSDAHDLEQWPTAVSLDAFRRVWPRVVPDRGAAPPPRASTPARWIRRGPRAQVQRSPCGRWSSATATLARRSGASRIASRAAPSGPNRCSKVRLLLTRTSSSSTSGRRDRAARRSASAPSPPRRSRSRSTRRTPPPRRRARTSTTRAACAGLDNAGRGCSRHLGRALDPDARRVRQKRKKTRRRAAYRTSCWRDAKTGAWCAVAARLGTGSRRGIRVEDALATTASLGRSGDVDDLALVVGPRARTHHRARCSRCSGTAAGRARSAGAARRRQLRTRCALDGAARGQRAVAPLPRRGTRSRRSRGRGARETSADRRATHCTLSRSSPPDGDAT